MTKPIVARLPDGQELGFADERAALSLHPDAVIVKYQDGSLLPEAEAAASKPLDKMTRDELNTVAMAAGVDAPEKMATKDDVVTAIQTAQAGA